MVTPLAIIAAALAVVYVVSGWRAALFAAFATAAVMVVTFVAVLIADVWKRRRRR